MDAQRQKHLVLILARAFASNLATPTLIADDEGQLVYYNEAAEGLVGQRFVETGEMPVEDWTSTFRPRTVDLVPVPPERRATRVALDERRAVHDRYRITSVDGVEREIEVTVFPLFAHEDELVGIVAIFWRT